MYRPTGVLLFWVHRLKNSREVKDMYDVAGNPLDRKKPCWKTVAISPSSRRNDNHLSARALSVVGCLLAPTSATSANSDAGDEPSMNDGTSPISSGRVAGTCCDLVSFDSDIGRAGKMAA